MAKFECADAEDVATAAKPSSQAPGCVAVPVGGRERSTCRGNCGRWPCISAGQPLGARRDSSVSHAYLLRHMRFMLLLHGGYLGP